MYSVCENREKKCFSMIKEKLQDINHNITESYETVDMACEAAVIFLSIVLTVVDILRC